MDSYIYRHQVGLVILLIIISINKYITINTISLGGTQWSQSSLPFCKWRACASDSTGQYLTAACATGNVWISVSG